MIKIGMMIGDRYEILEKIGTGGMSDVYKAKCHKLNRLVAVKVLKQEFSENANFVSKFQVEAQAAAGLMHPNIVNVYDVGEENGVYYIVMELVEGLTLKRYIEKKARLSVKESLTIATQICMGIEAAHNNHIIHRDIKPQNVIISKEGKVKVTDFGIAKAATSNTITSNVMGSVHYTSPEQARGGFSDEKSDVYSLGITLFEMLTGRVPFNGDTTVAIAIKQIQEEMPSPREFVPEIPLSVEQIVLKCTQKSPDRRYQSMSELIEDLRHSYTNPDDDFVRIRSEDEFAPTVALSQDDLNAVKRNVRVNDTQEETAITATLPTVEDIDDIEDKEYDPHMDRITTILAIVVGVIICIVAVLLIFKAVGKIKIDVGSKTTTSESLKIESIIMPAVTLRPYEEAKKILEDNNLICKPVYVESDEFESGIVISTSVNEGLKVDTGTEIEVTVSAGTETLTVPDVVGKTKEEANNIIIDAQLKVNVEEEHSDTVEAGKVISQVPEGNDKAPIRSTVTIKVSSGPSVVEFAMPDFVGETEEAALKEIEECKLVLNDKKYSFSDEFPKGLVISQSIDEGTIVKEGDTVDITISLGKESESNGVYYFSGEILAPTTNEDADYVSGTEVHIVIKTATGEVIYDTKETHFPIRNVNIRNILGVATGTVSLTYEVKLDSSTEFDPDTGETVIVPGVTEERTITREVEFSAEE